MKAIPLCGDRRRLQLLRRQEKSLVSRRSALERSCTKAWHQAVELREQRADLGRELDDLE